MLVGTKMAKSIAALLLCLQKVQSVADPCAGLYGAEGLTCAWGEDVKTCMAESCKGCSGEQCSLCQQDASRIETCCEQHWHSTTPPEMCKKEEPTPSSPCDGLYGAESLTCAWGEDVKTCMAESCKGCGGEQCSLCQQDASRIETCCEQHWHSTTPPEMCQKSDQSNEEQVKACVEEKCRGCGGEQCTLCKQDAQAACEASSMKSQPKKKAMDACAGLYGAEGLTCAWGEDVKTCMAESCKGCGGEQCSLCQQDASRIEACCEQHWHSTTPPEMCKKEEPTPSSPCDGLYGAESLTCAWGEDVKTCMAESCKGCGGEQCSLCQQDASRIETCCEQHWHSTTPPEMCQKSDQSNEEQVKACVEEKCRGCGGEQCTLCKQDAQAACEASSMKSQPKKKAMDACAGLYGAEGLTCAWGEDVKTCMAESCKGCSGEQCSLCQQDASRIETCCEQHWHSTTPPEMCKKEEPTPSSPCDGLYGAESLTCAWGEDVKTCMAESCKGCGGEQCSLCQQDASRIETCCEQHWHSTTPPEMCQKSDQSNEEQVKACVEEKCRGCGGEQCTLCKQDAQAACEASSMKSQPKKKAMDACAGLYGAEGLTCAWGEDVKTCMAESCKGCSGEQCSLCQQDASRIETCCEQHWHSTTPPEMCKKEEPTPSSPCDGLYGAESLTCAWGEDVKTCMAESCKGCGGEQCSLCQQDASRIETCCEQHWHSTTPPEMCQKSDQSNEEQVKACVEEKCRGCGGEQCTLCKQDAQAACEASNLKSLPIFP